MLADDSKQHHPVTSWQHSAVRSVVAHAILTRDDKVQTRRRFALDGEVQTSFGAGSAARRYTRTLPIFLGSPLVSDAFAATSSSDSSQQDRRERPKIAEIRFGYKVRQVLFRWLRRAGCFFRCPTGVRRFTTEVCFIGAFPTTSIPTDHVNGIGSDNVPGRSCSLDGFMK